MMMYLPSIPTLALVAVVALTGSVNAAPAPASSQRYNLDNPIVNPNGTTTLLGYQKATKEQAEAYNQAANIPSTAWSTTGKLGSGKGVYLTQKAEELKDEEGKDWFCPVWAPRAAFKAAPKVWSGEPGSAIDTCLQTQSFDAETTLRSGIVDGVMMLLVPDGLLASQTLNQRRDQSQNTQIQLKLGAQCLSLTDAGDLKQYPVAQYNVLGNYVDCDTALLNGIFL